MIVQRIGMQEGTASKCKMALANASHEGATEKYLSHLLIPYGAHCHDYNQ